MKPPELKGRNLALRTPEHGALSGRPLASTFFSSTRLVQSGTYDFPAVQAFLVPLHPSFCSWWE